MVGLRVMNTGKPTIAAVLIVKNESELLARCLDSVKGVDEIIICDTGSEDNTIEIARKYTDKVFTDFAWNDRFCDARNHAKAKTQCDWILSIDADEILHDFKAVEEAVRLANERNALAVDISLIAEDNGQRHFFPRLFKNYPQVWWEGAVHNHLSVIGERLGNVEITFGYSPAHFKDPDRAFRILSKEVNTRPDAVRETFYLGREHWYRREYDKCVIEMGKYVQRSQFLSEKADAFLIMGRCYWEMKMGDDARDATVQALIINPNFKEACQFMSEIVWPKHASQWLRMAETATNEDVLFKRA